MNQRGSVVLYLLVSIALSIGTGYGVYAWIRDHKSAAPAPVEVKTEPPPRPALAPQPQPLPDVPPAEPPPMSVAEQRAVNPIVDADSNVSPVMGLPGIDGPIERGSVDRRMRVKGLALQSCYERNGDSPTTIRMTMFVDERGHVTKTSVSKGLSDATEACILSVLDSISFSPQGKPAEVVQPIAFR